MAECREEGMVDETQSQPVRNTKGNNANIGDTRWDRGTQKEINETKLNKRTGVGTGREIEKVIECREAGHGR